MAGLDHYVSWITVAGRGSALQYSASDQPRVIDAGGLEPGQVACLHVQAVDRVGNATGVQTACAAPLAPPPMPPWHPAMTVAANPAPRGLVGLDAWLWLTPSPAKLTAEEFVGGADYVVTATPDRVDWSFGDGATASALAPSGFGDAYPTPSTVTHVFGAYSEAGYTITAVITYRAQWSEVVNGRALGPYPLGTFRLDASPLTYAVEQAQPELLDV